MIWRILVAVLYAGAFGALMALDNGGDYDTALLAAWIAAPLAGFLVGRWWALFAVLAALAGSTIGWDPGEHDGTSALWPPRAVTTAALLSLPLVLGILGRKAWENRHLRPDATGR